VKFMQNRDACKIRKTVGLQSEARQSHLFRRSIRETRDSSLNFRTRA